MLRQPWLSRSQRLFGIAGRPGRSGMVGEAGVGGPTDRPDLRRPGSLVKAAERHHSALHTTGQICPAARMSG